MKYSKLLTARRREEIYPPHIKWLACDKNDNIIGYLDSNAQPVELELEENEEVTPEKIVQSFTDLITERDDLRKQLEKKNASADVSGMQKRFMAKFSIRGDDPEEVYGLESRPAAEALVERNRDKYGSVDNVDIREYYIAWKE